MVRRVAIVLGVALTVVLAALSIVVIGIRTKYPPVLNRVRRYARDVGNPRQLRSAGTPGAHASVLRHTGRKSGKQYQTPVTARWTADGFVIGLPYGPNTDWLKNVLSAGRATIRFGGASHDVDHPELVGIHQVDEYFAPKEQRAHERFQVHDALMVRTVGT